MGLQVPEWLCAHLICKWCDWEEPPSGAKSHRIEDPGDGRPSDFGLYENPHLDIWEALRKKYQCGKVPYGTGCLKKSVMFGWVHNFKFSDTLCLHQCALVGYARDQCHRHTDPWSNLSHYRNTQEVWSLEFLDQSEHHTFFETPCTFPHWNVQGPEKQSVLQVRSP